MPYVLIIHEVNDYQQWKVIFDEAAGIRKEAGEISYQLLSLENEVNTIVHYSEWSSLKNARQFFESEKLIEIRKNAGVKSPNFIYLHELARGIL